MLKFNNNHIFTNYIQELLSSVYLPTCLIYNPKEPILYSTNQQPILYYKDGGIQYCTRNGTENNWKYVDTGYYLDKKALNQSEKFIIKSNIYTREAHEYLGKYLRYLRDTQGIDLMSQYNCFSDTYCNNLAVELDFGNSGYKATFNSSDTAYKIYMLPVRLFKEYTIAIDCSGLCEIFCGFYSKYFYKASNSDTDQKNALETFYKFTYEKHRNLKFNTPLLYSKLAQLGNTKNQTMWESITQNVNFNALLDSLVMFIKLPSKNNSSIAVLEGNYKHFGDAVYKCQKKINEDNTVDITYRKLVNNFTTNYEADLADKTFRPITTLQLLQANDQTNHPFSDRLIEYLLENAITSRTSEIPDNIKRVQAVMEKTGMLNSKIPGVWEPKMRRLAYDYMSYYPVEWTDAEVTYDNNPTKSTGLVAAKRQPFSVTINKDSLGYIDKDVENQYQIDGTSLANINIYSKEDK